VIGALLAGCASDLLTRWGDVAVVDARDEPAAGAPRAARDELERFAAVAAVPAARVDEVRLVDFIHGPGSRSLENLAPDASGTRAAGRYRRWRRLIEVAPDGDLLAASGLRHELCHALDDASGIGDANADWLVLDALPEDVREETVFRKGHETAEVFAKLCEQEPPSWIDRTLEDACGFAIVDPELRRAQELAFPGEVVTGLPPVELPITWVTFSKPTPATVVLEIQPIAGASVAHLVDPIDSTESVGQLDVAASRFVGLVALEHATDWSLGRSLLPSDGPIVLLGHQGARTLVLADGELVPLALPEGPWAAGAVANGVVVAHGDGLVAWDLATSVATDLAVPDEADPVELALGIREGVVALSSRGQEWQLEGGEWVLVGEAPTQLPQAYAAVTLPQRSPARLVVCLGRRRDPRGTGRPFGGRGRVRARGRRMRWSTWIDGVYPRERWARRHPGARRAGGVPGHAVTSRARTRARVTHAPAC
jgi:hypothetical protein